MLRGCGRIGADHVSTRMTSDNLLSLVLTPKGSTTRLLRINAETYWYRGENVAREVGWSGLGTRMMNVNLFAFRTHEVWCSDNLLSLRLIPKGSTRRIDADTIECRHYRRQSINVRFNDRTEIHNN